MKLFKCTLASLLTLTLVACGNNGPSDSIVETKVIELIQEKVRSGEARDSLEFVQSTCEPRQEENVWRCVVTVQATSEGEVEKNTMSYIFTKANGAWFARGPKPVSREEREAAEGTD